MASVQEMNLTSLGQAAYEARVAIRGGRAALAAELGFASGGSLANCANKIFYGKVAPSRQSSETDKPEVKVNPAEQNTVLNAVAASVRKQICDMQIMNRDIPALYLTTVDGIQSNPEFVTWFAAQSETVLSALQGNIADSIWDANLFLCGVSTPRRIAAMKAQQEKERVALEQAKSIMVSAGYITIHREQFDAMIQDRAMSLLAPSTMDIFTMLSDIFPFVREPAIAAHDGNGMQYYGDGCLDSRATFSDVLPKADRGCPHVLFYRLRIGEGSKAEQASELKRAKAEQAKHSSVEATAPTILADWKAYHETYQAQIETERAIEAAKAAKAAKLAALLEMDDSDLEAFLAAKKAKAA